jgi:hypothetical protein
LFSKQKHRRSCDAYALLLWLVADSEQPLLLVSAGSVGLQPANEEAARVLALLCALLAELCSTRALSLALASAQLCSALRLSAGELLAVQRLVVERATLLPAPVWSADEDPFDQLVA